MVEGFSVVDITLRVSSAAFYILIYELGKVKDVS